GGFKFSSSILYSTCKRTFNVPEQFTLYQLTRYGSTINLYHWPFAAFTFLMQPMGYQFFTCSIWPCNKYSSICLCYFFNNIFYMRNGFTFANHFEILTNFFL